MARKYKGPVSLASDWSYSAPYELDESAAEPLIYPPDTHPFIHAYNTRAEARKARFLKDASTYLWTVGQELIRFGFGPSAAVSNPAGIASPGDVWCNYQQPDLERWIYLHISESSVSTVGEAQPLGASPVPLTFTTRKDRIAVMGRWREMPPKGTRGDPKSWRSLKEGPNTWYNANLDSRQLAERILLLLDIVIPEHAKALRQASLFDAAAAA